MKNTFEKQLPNGYIEAKHINANNKKTGIMFNLAAILIMAIIAVGAILLLIFGKCRGGQPLDISVNPFISIAFAVLLVLYIVLHELVHGAVYKLLTRQKLTFGMTLSCAFCGLPDVYTYRKTALLALLAPFTVFTVLLMPLCAVMYFTDTYAYLLSALLFGIHIGGCSGDLYMTFLLLFKYKPEDTLIRDTGPEQHIYLKNTESER